MNKVFGSLSELAIAEQSYKEDDDKWLQASAANATKSFAQREESRRKIKREWNRMEASITWTKGEGGKWSDLQDHMNKEKIDEATQGEVQELWDQAPEAKA